MVNAIAKMAAERGGCAYYVGGCVRDRIMGRECKDIDIEIHGLTPNQTEDILDALGERIETGKSFGVYGLKGYNIDIALPRTEAPTGKGHRDFKINVEPFIGAKKAAQRRDFTINSLMQNVLTGEIIDFFGGINDISCKKIRHIDDNSFSDDPLRVLRAAQFAARFGFEIVPQTYELCRKIDITTLSCERVAAEMKKALLKAEKPSVFFEILREMDQLSFWFYETEQLINVPQNIKYHQEGDVWAHTMMVVDEAAKMRDSVKNPMGFMLSALAHDFGKITSTEIKDGIAHSYMHEEKGLPLVKDFMNRITNEKRLTSYVMNMSKLHMKPNITAGAKSSVKATNRMFDDSVEPLDLIALSQCDGFGKIPRNNKEMSENKKFLLERYDVYNEYMSKPYVTGKDLISAGLKPCAKFGEILSFAHKLRLAGVKKESALKQTLSYARQIQERIF